jgi:predicted dehydrogenase/threonine dehydrogenase-like Zn-dependent dehydrogenase
MKQILQNLKNGDILIEKVPTPSIRENHILIKTTKTLISTGTEKTLLSFGKSSYLNKARQQPEKVQQVINKIKVDGLKETISSVTSKLDTPLPLGYCNVGVVEEVGHGVTEFKVGDRVASNGSHSEYVCVSKNLCAKIPNEVSDEEALFTVPGSIALQGIRLCKTEIGETVVVYGLGLLGLIAIQILKASGCKVIGIDKSEDKVKIGQSYGIDCTTDFANLKALVKQSTSGMGADKVLITASTNSNDLLHEAATISRKKGKIVLVGMIGREWNRSDFYEKELEFQVSCSYGAGRYDKLYEDYAIDYPYAYVRWTEQRNFSTILNLLKNKSILTSSLLSDNVELKNSEKMYNKILNDSSLIGISISYEADSSKSQIVTFNYEEKRKKEEKHISVGFIGSGNFTKQVLLPKIMNLKKNMPITLDTIVSQGGVSSTHLAKKFSFNNSSTRVEDVLENPEINTVFITTQSDTHAELVIRALKNRKNVFVEKPICIDLNQLDKIKNTLIEYPDSKLLIGFNRRYSQHIKQIKNSLNKDTPKSITMLINAGSLPDNHWHHDLKIGGGRIVHEGVHFIDLANHLVDSKVTTVYTNSFKNDKTNDKFTINLSYEDGSIATINYWANGNNKYPKESIIIFDEGRIMECNNFKSTNLVSSTKQSKKTAWSQDKGHESLYKEFFSSILNSSKSPIDIESQIHSTYVSFLALQSLIDNQVLSNK